LLRRKKRSRRNGSRRRKRRHRRKRKRKSRKLRKKPGRRIKRIRQMLQTNRLILRPWREADAVVLFKWAADPDVGPRAGWPPHKSEEESLEIIRTVFNNDSNWAIELRETGEAIGAIGYGPSCDCRLPARDGEPLCGYWVAKPYWNRGICTEALRLMLDHIRSTTEIKSLISGHFVDNSASGRVMEKCGFIPTGETCIDETQYQGAGRPIRVLRLELR
jgi:RimJ/RimL family protein N-acetyltransferase